MNFYTIFWNGKFFTLVFIMSKDFCSHFCNSNSFIETYQQASSKQLYHYPTCSEWNFHFIVLIIELPFQFYLQLKWPFMKVVMSPLNGVLDAFWEALFFNIHFITVVFSRTKLDFTVSFATNWGLKIVWRTFGLNKNSNSPDSKSF